MKDRTLQRTKSPLNLHPCGRAIWLLAACAVSVSGCASMRSYEEKHGTAAPGVDPIEPLNRAVFFVNEKIDRAVLKPLAKGYEFVLPRPVRSCISNGFSNVSDVPISLNNVMQARFKEASSDVSRVGVNTTVGLLGCFDVASGWGLEKHNADFGLTLGHWGIASGPYVVLPFFGPSSARDGAALLVDSTLDPLVRVPAVPPRNIAYGLRVVDSRQRALTTTNLVDDAALDPYTFARDGYLTRRRNLVKDGDGPPDPGNDRAKALTSDK